MFLVGFAFVGQPACATPLMNTEQFRAMQADGFSHQTALAFADLAEGHSDESAAIAALEQSVLQNGPDVRVHARLAELYARIGNEGLAEHHADLAGTKVEPEAGQLWGRIGVGIAHDSNPTAAESSAQIRVFDAQSNSFLNVAARDEEPDTLATVSLDLNTDHRLSPEALLAAEFSLAGEKYFDTGELDNITGSFAIGPWMGPGEISTGDVWFRPYLTLSGASLDGKHYYTSYGAGGDLRVGLGADLQAAFGAAILRTDYNGRISQDFDTNTLDNTAVLLSAGISGLGPLDSEYSIQVSGSAADALRSSESYLHVGLEAGITVPIPSVGELTGMPLALRFGGTLDRFSYTDEDPNVDPTRERRDLWFGGEGSLLLTIRENVDLIFGAEYVRQTSNIAAFETDNLRVYTELGFRF